MLKVHSSALYCFSSALPLSHYFLLISITDGIVTVVMADIDEDAIVLEALLIYIPHSDVIYPHHDCAYFQ